jgi:hypothetical protein
MKACIDEQNRNFGVNATQNVQHRNTMRLKRRCSEHLFSFGFVGPDFIGDFRDSHIEFLQK